MRTSSLRLSVAIITCNRPDSLERGLASLRSQSIQPFEIVVSDDSGEKHATGVRRLVVEYGAIYCVGPRRGLYANRNFAATQCNGSHIRTMDDDHILPLDHLSRCMEAVKSDTGSIWTTGELSYLNGAAFHATETANQLGPAGVGEQIKDNDNNWGIADGSTIYPREVFDLGFRMVEDFGFGSSYLEFGAYLYKNGWRSRCIPKAAVEHYSTEFGSADPLSLRFAAICFNCYFRPDRYRMFRHLAPHWQSWTKLPRLYQMAYRRWNNL